MTYERFVWPSQETEKSKRAVSNAAKFGKLEA